jgi:hypothetical protein
VRDTSVSVLAENFCGKMLLRLVLQAFAVFYLGCYIETLNTKICLIRFLLESGKEKSKRERKQRSESNKREPKHTDTHKQREREDPLLLLCVLLFAPLSSSFSFVEDKREKIPDTKFEGCRGYIRG